jgi:hypothetical protein
MKQDAPEGQKTFLLKLLDRSLQGAIEEETLAAGDL